MSIHDSEAADAFEKLADLLEIGNAKPFRVRAYGNAALHRLTGSKVHGIAVLLQRERGGHDRRYRADR